MTKENIEKLTSGIREIPNFLGFEGGSFDRPGKNYELDLKNLKEDKRSKYALFSIKDRQNDENKEFVRFSENGHHIDIVEGIIDELKNYINLSAEDIKYFNYSALLRLCKEQDLDEPPILIKSNVLEVKVYGGGYVCFDPQNKEIRLIGGSRNLGLGDQEQQEVHKKTGAIIKDWLKKKKLTDYVVKIP